MNYLIFIGVALMALAYTKKEQIVELLSDNRDSLLYKKFYNEINYAISKYKLSVTKSEVLATIKHESGFLGLTKDNSEIIGDISFKNKAYGVMQVRKPAMLDVNSNLGTNFNENDLLDLQNNIVAGSGYLHLCKIQAKRENPDYLQLMFKKYNAGIGSKESSLLGKDYAVLSIKLFNAFNNIA